jgi:hypothetical protein
LEVLALLAQLVLKDHQELQELLAQQDRKVTKDLLALLD